jgi:hypothetical protein
MTSSTATMTSSSPHFLFRSSTNFFHYPSIVVCIVVRRVCHGVVICVDVCMVVCIVVVCIVPRQLCRGVVICIAALSSALRCSCLRGLPSSASWHCCLRCSIVVSIAAALSALQRPHLRCRPLSALRHCCLQLHRPLSALGHCCLRPWHRQQ